MIDSTVSRVFVEEFKREVARLGQQNHQCDDAAIERLAVVRRDLQNLMASLLPGILHPIVQTFLADREAENALAESVPQPISLRQLEEEGRPLA